MQAVIAAPERGLLDPITNHNSQYMLPTGANTMIGEAIDTLSEAGVDRISLNADNNSVKQALNVDRGVEKVERDGVEITFVRPRQDETAGLSEDEGYLWMRADALYDSDEVAAVATEDKAIGYSGSKMEETHGAIDVHDGYVDSIDVGTVPQSGSVAADIYKFPRQAHSWPSGEEELERLTATEEAVAVEVSSYDPIVTPSDLLWANMNRYEPGEDDHRSSVLAGDNRIAQNAVVEESVLLPGAEVGANSYVSHSVIGSNVTLGANVAVETERPDGQQVVYEVGGERVGSDSDEFGVVVGDGANVRAGSSLSEGTVIGPGATLEPGSTR